MFWKISQNSQLNTRCSHPKVFCQKMFLRILYNLQKNIFVRVSLLIKLQPGNLKLSQAAIGDALQNFFANFLGKHLHWSLFLTELWLWGSATLLKKGFTTGKICEIFKSNYFEEHLWTATSKLHLKRESNPGVFLWILWIIQEHLFYRAYTNSLFFKH